MSQVALQIRNLAIVAGGKTLHQPISFDLLSGELVAITGPSGSGKTTLLRTIVGLQDGASGSVLLDGKEPAHWGWPEFRRRVILVTQRPTMLALTVEETLSRPFSYRSCHATFPKERAIALLDILGVGSERMTQQARTLSIGQQQRLSLIRALILEPQILCMDEPTSALDAASVLSVQKLVSDEAQSRGLSALIVTHSAEQVTTWCDRELKLGASK